MRFVNIGYGNIIAIDKVISIITPGAAPIKRMVQEAKQNGLIIDRNHRKKNTCSNCNGFRTHCTFCFTTRNNNK